VAKDDAAAAGGDAKPARSRKMLLFIIAPLLLLVLAGGGAYFFLGGKKEEEHVEAAQPAKPSIYYKLPEFLVNLNARSGRSTFLKLTLSLEFDDEGDVRRVQSMMPRVVDSIQALLRELRTEDLKNSAALTRLREELLSRVSGVVQPTKVVDVLFQEVLLQ
jgi:flagellar FliL protein